MKAHCFNQWAHAAIFTVKDLDLGKLGSSSSTALLADIQNNILAVFYLWPWQHVVSHFQVLIINNFNGS